MNIVEALTSSHVFEPWFHGKSWAAWFVIVKAAFGLPLSDDEAAIFMTLAGGRAPPRNRIRELWVISGRRAGKDSMASAIVTFFAAIECAHIDHLRPGEKASVLLIASDREQAQICKGYCAAFFEIPELAAMITRETRNGFELNNGAEICIVTNNFRAVRGRTILCAVLDEVAFYRDEHSANPDIETFRALAPGLLTIPDAMLIGISSPYRKAGLLYDKYRAHYGQDNDRVLVIQAPSIALNPTIDQAEIDAAMIADPFAARAEYEAQFRDDISDFISLEMIAAVVDKGVDIRHPQPGIFYTGYVDAATGMGKDSFAIAVGHREDNEHGVEIIIVDFVYEFKPPFSPAAVVAKCAEYFKAYGIVHEAVHADAFALGIIIEMFRDNGIRLEKSERNTSDNYLNCLPLIASGQVRLLDIKRLIEQFASLERTTNAGGKDTVSHPVNGNRHDDLSASVAGLLTQISSAKKPMTIEGLERQLAAIDKAGPYMMRNSRQPIVFTCRPSLWHRDGV